MLKITIIDQNGPEGLTTTEHEVAIIGDFKNNFQFKSSHFPPPTLGKKFFVSGREIEVAEQGRKVEEGRMIFYFSATFIAQP